MPDGAQLELPGAVAGTAWVACGAYGSHVEGGGASEGGAWAKRSTEEAAGGGRAAVCPRAAGEIASDAMTASRILRDGYMGRREAGGEVDAGGKRTDSPETRCSEPAGSTTRRAGKSSPQPPSPTPRREWTSYLRACSLLTFKRELPKGLVCQPTLPRLQT